MDTLRPKPSLEDAIVNLAHGFTDLFSRMEKEQQLTPENFALFNKSYMAAYPDMYRAIVASYRDSGIPWHPLEDIRNATDRHQEREKQALLAVGAKMLEMYHDEVLVQRILAHLAFKNEIDMPETDVIPNITRMQNLVKNASKQSADTASEVAVKTERLP